MFRQTGALLEGHFVLRAGLHSRQFFQCALLLQHTDVAARVCAQLADKLRDLECDSVISPALVGINFGQGSRPLVRRAAYVADKQAGGLVLRCAFTISRGEKLIVAKDVVTRGERVRENIVIVRQRGGQAVGVGLIVDRTGGKRPDFGCPFVSLIEMEAETFFADALPPDLRDTPNHQLTARYVESDDADLSHILRAAWHVIEPAAALLHERDHQPIVT